MKTKQNISHEIPEDPENSCDSNISPSNKKEEDKKSQLQDLLGDEFNVKKFSLYVFFWSGFSYLMMTIVRGKGSLPLWVQIPTTVLYLIFVILTKKYGNDMKYQPIFNKWIPVFILIMYIPNMTFTNLNAYESEVIWAFCLSTIFTLFQMFSLLYGLPIKQQLILTLLGLVSIISNIERQSTWCKQLRFETYPYIICCVISANLIQAQLWKVKDKLINELTCKNSSLFESQKLIFNSMQQGVVLVNSDYISDKNSNNGVLLQFMNSQIQKNFIKDLKRFPKFEKKFEKFLSDRQIINEDDIDFINDPEAFKFLSCKMYTRKQESNNYDGLGQLMESMPSSSKGSMYSSNKTGAMSLYDLIVKIDKYPDQMKEETYQLINKNSKKIEYSQDYEKKYFVINWFEMTFADKDCKMIQFVDISQTVMYDQAVQQKNFSSMLNATVSHELRGPINSIQQNIQAQGDQILELKSFRDEILDIILILKGEKKEDSIVKTQFKGLAKMKKILDKIDHTLEQFEYHKTNMNTGTKLLSFYVQDLLDLAQLKAGTIQKNIEMVNVNNPLQEILQTQELQAKAKGINLSYKPILFKDTGNHVMVAVDAQRMQQVTLNLLTNALKFTRKDGKIELGGEYQQVGDNNYLMVYVKDDGDGIAAEDKPKLFKLFGKLKQKKGINSRGIGLGLNICKQICELFDGNIDVDSVKGMGSTFYFTFKVDDNTYEKQPSAELQAAINSFPDLDLSQQSDIFSYRDDQIAQGCLSINSVVVNPKQKLAHQFQDEEALCHIQYDEDIQFEIQKAPIYTQNDENSSGSNSKYIESCNESRDLCLNSNFNKNLSKQAYACILIVDDSVLNLLGLKCQLNQIKEIKNHANAIDEALNGEEAVQLFQQRIDLCIESNWLIKPYRIIFIDYNMPLCDGPTAVEKIRKICEDIKLNDVLILKTGGAEKVPSLDSIKEFRQLTHVQRDIYLNPFIVVLSGESDLGCINRAINSGANRFMEKPTPFKDIQAAIQPYLNNQ